MQTAIVKSRVRSISTVALKTAATIATAIKSERMVYRGSLTVTSR